jgi:uncharacterized membrane protein YbaN (DUF454 family)
MALLTTAVVMRRRLTQSARAIWVIVGIVALVLGALGVLIPLLPTTPFVLVAAFAFANSSDRLHTWLVNHNIFGPLIDDWRRHGAICRSAKIAGVLSMIAVIGISLVLEAPTWIVLVQALVLSACAFFVISRPIPPD